MSSNIEKLCKTECEKGERCGNILWVEDVVILIMLWKDVISNAMAWD